MKINDKFIVSSVAGENVILPIDNECVDYDSVFVLNGTGMFIVSLMPAEYKDIVDAVVAKYEVSNFDARTHVTQFLRELKANGILEGFDE